VKVADICFLEVSEDTANPFQLHCAPQRPEVRTSRSGGP
jgi:hypothetical protein